MLLFAAHWAIGIVTCGSVIDTRAMYGDLLTMIEVAAFMMIVGILASVTTGAAARALGVRPNPTMNSTLSRVINSCTRRLAISGCAPVASLTISSILRPETVSPLRAT